MALAQSIPEKPRKFLPYKSVLIISDNHASAAELCPTLQQSGYNTVTSLCNGNRLQGIPRQAPDVILLNFLSPDIHYKAITDALRRRFENKNVPIIGIFDEDSAVNTELFDSVLFEPVHNAQIAHRIGAMIRLNIMQTEIALRMETLSEDFGINYRLNPEAFSDRLRVLFVGKATPEFMIIINALERKNVEVVAAFTSFTAFDFLHETTFDAVVMNALNGMEPGLTISQTMRRNSSLYHTPSLLLAHRGNVETTNAYEHGVSDILYSDADERDIQDRIMELARFHRLHRQVKTEFENLGQAECLDESGTYSTAFFSKHLNRLVDNYSAQDLPVSLVTLQADFDGPSPQTQLEKNQVLNQLGSMIKNMIRVYDVAARLSGNIFVIAFPGQPAATLNPVVRRLESISKATEFVTYGGDASTYRVKLNIDLAELGHGVTGETWLAQQIANPDF